MQKLLTNICGLGLTIAASIEILAGNPEGLIVLSIVFLAWKLTDEDN